MSRLSDKLYRRVMAWRGRVPQAGVDLSFLELLTYFWKRGGPPWLRGLLGRFRFGSCAGRLFLGKRITLFFPKRISLGRNVYLGDFSYLNGLAHNGIRVGDNVSIREFAWIQSTSTLEDLGEGLVIGSNTYIGPHITLGAAGGIQIGSNVLIGGHVDILAENHQFRDPDRLIREQGVTRSGIVIEDDVWIGNRATILDGIRIGRGAVVGAAAVVTRDVPANAVVVGNPARVVGHRGALGQPELPLDQFAPTCAFDQ